jgi:uncharacterized membrane protein YeaQ/YmgE (transglycosylase-associated protein family)
MPGRDPGDIVATILLGIVGATVERFLTQNLLGIRGSGFVWTIIVTTLGAIILLAIYRLLVGRRRT